MSNALNIIASLASRRFVVDQRLFLLLSNFFFQDEPDPHALDSIVAQLPAGSRDVLAAHAGVDKHFAPSRYASALDLAAKDAKPWALAALATIFDPNVRPDGLEPLIFIALRRGDAFALPLLATGRIDVEMTGVDWLTPLALAAAHSRLDSMRALIGLGASPLSTMSVYDGRSACGGVTPLMIAAKLARVEAIHLLAPLSKLSASDDQGRDALYYAASSPSPQADEAATALREHLLAARELDEIGEAAIPSTALGLRRSI